MSSKAITVEQYRKSLSNKIAKSRGKKRSKYGNVKVTTADGIFDSGKEMRELGKLKLRELAGEISDLRWKKSECRQPLTVNGIVIGHYTPDYIYIERGVVVWHDCKSDITKRETSYRLRKRLVKAIYGIDIKES